MSRWIERLAIVAASLAIAIGVIALLSGGLLAGRDTPGVAGTDQGPGTAYRDQGNTHLGPGEARPAYDSDPPTSGPHLPAAVVADRARLTDDQLLEALAAGDVVYMYGTSTPPPGLAAVARAMAPPFSAALAASGQAVILARRPGTTGVLGLAWAHALRASGPTDPELRAFTQYWLGRGAPRSSGALPKS
jgi:Protein of unknown function (DUF3105)